MPRGHNADHGDEIPSKMHPVHSIIIIAVKQLLRHTSPSENIIKGRKEKVFSVCRTHISLY